MRDWQRGAHARHRHERSYHDLSNRNQKSRHLFFRGLDVHDWDMLGEKFGIARAMVQEIEYINDEHGQTPEHRFEAVRKWAEGQLLGTQDSGLATA